jgi:hypothetical protein
MTRYSWLDVALWLIAILLLLPFLVNLGQYLARALSQ